MAKTKNFIEAIRAKLASDPKLAGLVDQEALNADLAVQVRSLREAAGLTQKDLAELVGTTQSVISRVEDADYEGHSLASVRRIAAALGKKVCLKLCSAEEKRRLLFASTNSEVRVVTPPAVIAVGGTSTAVRISGHDTPTPIGAVKVWGAPAVAH